MGRWWRNVVWQTRNFRIWLSLKPEIMMCPSPKQGIRWHGRSLETRLKEPSSSAVSVSAVYVQVLTTFCYENHWFVLQNLWFWEVSDIYFLLFLHYISLQPFKTSFPTNISIFFLLKHNIINFRPGGNQILGIWMKILHIWLIDKGDLCQNFPAPRAHSRHAYCGAGVGFLAFPVRLAALYTEIPPHSPLNELTCGQ